MVHSFVVHCLQTKTVNKMQTARPGSAVLDLPLHQTVKAGHTKENCASTPVNRLAPLSVMVHLLALLLHDTLEAGHMKEKQACIPVSHQRTVGNTSDYQECTLVNCPCLIWVIHCCITMYYREFLF